jgi:hypothetical protein
MVYDGRQMMIELVTMIAECLAAIGTCGAVIISLVLAFQRNKPLILLEIVEGFYTYYDSDDETAEREKIPLGSHGDTEQLYIRAVNYGLIPITTDIFCVFENDRIEELKPMITPYDDKLPQKLQAGDSIAVRCRPYAGEKKKHGLYFTNLIALRDTGGRYYFKRVGVLNRTHRWLWILFWKRGVERRQKA